MKTAGIICEYNPLHSGHIHLMEQWRRRAGEDSAIVCAMSGNFVQRGDFALLRKHARAEAAVRCGADLVLELPAACAVSTAEHFARSGVALLSATGVVDTLLFGSECGDLKVLSTVAEGLSRLDESDLFHCLLQRGESYAAARQKAMEELLGEEAALLAQPNNILAVEYLKALGQSGSGMEAMTVARAGAGYHDEALEEEHPSASGLRKALQQGEGSHILHPVMEEVFRREQQAGRAPVWTENCQRAILAKLRSMKEEEFLPYDGGKEGLYHRFYQAVQRESCIEDILQRVKTRRYSYARLRRMLLRAYLGLSGEGTLPAYLRVLACNEKGRELLRQMKTTATLPVITKPAQARALPEKARLAFEQEAGCTDLYVLAYPELSQACCGSDWTENTLIL